VDADGGDGEDSRPSWVPEGVEVKGWDSAALTVDLAVRRSPLVLGDVPPGAVVGVEVTTGIGVAVTSSSVGPGAVLQWKRGTSLELQGGAAGFETVELSPGRSEVRCTLASAGVTVRLLGPGQFRLDGAPHHLEVSPGAGRTRVQGSAPIASLSSQADNLVVSGPVEVGAALVLGGARSEFKSALDQVELDAPVGSVVATSLTGGRVTARNLTVDVLRSVRVTIAGELRVHDMITDSSEVTLTEDAAGPCAVWAAGSNPPLEVPSDHEQHVPSRAVSQAGGAVRGSTIRVLGGAPVILGSCEDSTISAKDCVRVGGVASNSSIAAGDQAIVGEVQMTDGTVLEAPCVRVGSISGGRVLSTWTWCDGVVGGAHLEGDCIDVRGTIERSHVLARRQLLVGGTTDRQSTLCLGGSADLGDVCEATLKWAPTEPSTITAAGLDSAMVVTQAKEARLDITKAPSRLVSLELDGHLAVLAHREVAKGRKPEETTLDLEVVQVGQGGTLTFLTGGLSVAAHEVSLGAGACLDSSSGGSATISIDTGAKVVSRRSSIQLVPAEQSLPLRGLTIEGSGRVDLAGSFFDVTCVGNDDGGPILAVPVNARVEEVSGDFRLGAIHGLLVGRTGRPASWRDSRRASDATRAPRVWRILPQGDEAQGQAADGGRVVSVDPTPCDYASLANADALRVFEPDQRALIDFATRDEDDQHQRRDDAYKAQRISEMVAKSAASGGARSAARWAAAKTHHRALSDAPIEEGLRRIHRLLGYGQRPIQPLLTYVAMVAIWTGVEWTCDRHPDAEGWGGFVQTVARIALVPASFVARLPTETDFHYVLDEAGWHALAFLTIGLPLVFFVLALRNFMAAPETSK
jgi:hypothetical protein